MTVVTFILLLLGTTAQGASVIFPVAEFDDREACEGARNILQVFPVKGYENNRLVCIENTEIHTLTQ